MRRIPPVSPRPPDYAIRMWLSETGFFREFGPVSSLRTIVRADTVHRDGMRILKQTATAWRNRARRHRISITQQGRKK